MNHGPRSVGWACPPACCRLTPAFPVCAVQLGAHHEALQKLVEVLPEIKHKVSGYVAETSTAREARLLRLTTRLQGQEVSWVEGYG